MQFGFKATKGPLPASLLLCASLWILVVQGQLLKPMTVMYSCHSKASISDLQTVHHRAPDWTGLGQMPVVCFEESIAATLTGLKSLLKASLNVCFKSRD